MAAGLVTPTEAGMGPSVLGIAASIGAKIRDAAEDAKEQREKAAEKGETPKKGSLFKSALSNQFNPIKSKKAKSNWAKQFDWNKTTKSDQQVKPPTGGGGGGEGKAKLKEFIAGGFTAILKDTGMMVSKLDGVKMMANENLSEVTRASSTLTVIKDSIDTQTELRRRALDEAKFARAEKKLEKTSDSAGVSDTKKPEDKKDGEGGGEDGGGGGLLENLANALGIADLVDNFLPGKKGKPGRNPLSRLNPFNRQNVTQGRGGQPAGPRLGGGPRITTSGGAPAPKPPGGFKLPKMPGLPKGIRPGSMGGPLTALFAGFEFAGRKSEGQNNLQAGVGTAGSVGGGLAGAALGAKGGALAGAAIGALFGGVGAVPGAAIGGALGGILGGIGGSMGGGKLADMATGADNLSEGGIVPSAVPPSPVSPMAKGGIAPGLYDNPTKGILSPGQSVIPLNRSEGKTMFGKSAATNPGETAIDTVGAMILGVSAGMLGKTDSGTVGDQVKQNIRKASKEFGISNLTFTSAIGNAQFGKVKPDKDAKDFMMSMFESMKLFGLGGGKSGGSGGKNNPPGGDPTGPISQAPKGNEMDIFSLQGSAGAPMDLSQNTDVATGTGLHHGKEDMRGGLRVRDYFIGKSGSGPSDGSDGLGAKLYTPLGFGPLIYKSRGPYGIDFLDPATKEKVGTYLHVDNAQHQQYEGKTVQPGTVVGTQGGLPGTPSALGSSSAVHLHVEGTDAFHKAVIRTYADGNIMKQQVGQQHGNVAQAQAQSPTVTQVAQRGMIGKAQDGMVGKKEPAWWDIGGRINSWLDNASENATINGNKFGGNRYKQQMKELGYAKGGKSDVMKANAAKLKAQRASQQRSRLGVQKVNGKWVNMGVSDQAVGKNPWWQVWNKKGATSERKAKQEALAKNLAERLNKQEAAKLKPKPPTASPARQPVSSGGTRPAPSSGGQSAVAAVMPPVTSSKESTAQATGSYGSSVPGGKTSAMVFADFLYPDLV